MSDQIQYRAMPTRPATAQAETRTVDVICTTESPVNQYDWETGRVTPEVMRMDGAVIPERVPLLDTHDRFSVDSVIGSVGAFRVEGGALLGVAAFSSTAETAWRKVAEGHLTDFSVGYVVNDVTRVPSGKTVDVAGRAYTGPVNVVTKWTLKELSACPIGADPAAKARGDMTQRGPQAPEGERIMEGKGEAQAPRVDVAAERSAARENGVTEERARVADITAMAGMWRGKCGAVDVDTLAREAVQKGTTSADFGLALQKSIAEALPIGPRAKIGMSEKETKNYSLLRALRAADPGIPESEKADCGLEREAHAATAKLLGRTGNGMFIPADFVMGARAGQSTLTMAAGGALVDTALRGDLFIDYLRNKMRVRQMGARVLTDLVGDLSIPKKTGTGTITWIGEGESSTQSGMTFGMLMMRPKTATGEIPMTRKLLRQSSMDVEMLAREDLALAMALGIDLASLHGSGLNNEPLGLAGTSGVNSVVAGDNGAAPSHTKLVEMETKIAVANADMGTMGYLVSPALAGKMKSTEKVSTTGRFLWEGPVGGQSEVNGYTGMASGQVKADYAKGSGTNLSACFFGDWAQLLIGMWGVLDVMVNPYKDASAGGVVVHVFQDVDVTVRYPQAFSFCNDFTTA